MLKKQTKTNAPTLDQIKAYFRAANYLAAAQIFLRGNFLVQKPLEPRHIKPRLLGHWGTCPGITFVHSHLNAYLTNHNESFMYVVGTGHGFPAVQACNYLDKSLQHYYPELLPDTFEGMKTLIRNFSWPYGFPSHTNPGSPGAILEGGELGYALSTSFGAVLDNPDLTVVALIGDGEAETGPTATAWHCNKFLNPRTSGAVLPILHLNGYKISGPTIFGRMSDQELTKLFEGYGYEVLFVDAFKKTDPHAQMHRQLRKAMRKIKAIQRKARSGASCIKPQWPMIIMRTPKGWTGISQLKGKDIENNFYAHQVVTKHAATDSLERKAVEQWLQSYHFEDLYHPKHGFSDEVLANLPPQERRLGRNPHALGGEMSTPLKLPDLKTLAIDIKKPGVTLGKSMNKMGEMFREIMKLNENEANFRLFSPDETYSNKLDAVFEVTNREWQWPIVKHDEDLGHTGRVIEMLSEHTLQGLMQGYTLTGRHGVFASYEAFLQIVSSMMDQYAKFMKASFEFEWRLPVPSFTYVLSSLGWRQDHNGYSHQNPSFVSNMLSKHGNLGSVYFPVDANSTLAIMEECLMEPNVINLVVAGKQEHLQWMTLEQARKQVKAGLGIWEWCSDPNPDLVFSSAGDFPTIEVMAAIKMLKEELPHVRVRYVNVSEMTALGVADPRSQTTGEDFERYFTKDKPVIFNYHGYTGDVKELIFDATSHAHLRFHIHGYQEQGSTTTPFDMQVRNKTDRFHLILEALTQLKEQKVITTQEANRLATKVTKLLEEHKAFIINHGEDPKYLTQLSWQ